MYKRQRYAVSNGQKYTASTGVKKNRLTSYTSLTYRTKDTYEIGDEVGKTTVTEGSDGSSAEEQDVYKRQVQRRMS